MRFLGLKGQVLRFSVINYVWRVRVLKHEALKAHTLCLGLEVSLSTRDDKAIGMSQGSMPAQRQKHLPNMIQNIS